MKRQHARCRQVRRYDIIGQQEYTKQLLKGRGSWMLGADFFWRLFELTGSITAYLIYKMLITQ
jgi:hypothetical protein